MTLIVGAKLVKCIFSCFTVAPNGMMYVKPHVRKSLLSKMLAELLDTRIMIKQSMQENRENKVGIISYFNLESNDI